MQRREAVSLPRRPRTSRSSRGDDGRSSPIYWLTTGQAIVGPALEGDHETDVAIIGGGFTGLWTALHLTDTHPDLRVALLEQAFVGYGASGRNGGFCEASLTHGLANGLRHFPDEIETLEQEGLANLRQLVAFIRSEDIDCDLEETGLLRLADCEHQVPEFCDWVETAAKYGVSLQFLDQEAVQRQIHSPIWKAGILAPPERNVILNPAKLVWGLKKGLLARGVRIHEQSQVVAVERARGRGLRVRTRNASVSADRVVVATSAYSGWLRRLTPLFAPVYDYVLVSEPLNTAQMDSIGWRGRQGLADANNQFHYFRLTSDDRILWGGYDAVYYFGSRVAPDLDRRPTTFARLELQFRRAFPQLADLRFPYRWGGAIDTTTRFTVTFGRSMGDRLLYALGYTGLGVGASRWAGGVIRDMILRPESDLLRLRFVRGKPFPFPPEPLRYPIIQVIRHELDRADRNHGRRGLLLRTLDRVGIGFDS
jgi:glycine/D-amino acid oxidase-like deaminating enzyme